MVGWAKGGGGCDVVSKGIKTLSNPTELGASDRENKVTSSLGPTGGSDVDGSDVDGTSANESVTPAGEEEAQLKAKHASPSLPKSSPHATTVSPGGDGLVPSGMVEAVVESANGDQNTKYEGGVPGEGVPTEHRPAQGTGTKAVRSLSRMGGGGREEESGEKGREAPTTISEGGGALTGTYVANSCGKFPSRR